MRTSVVSVPLTAFGRRGRVDPLPTPVWRLTTAVGLAATADWYVLFAVFWIAADRGWSGGLTAVFFLAARAPTFVGGILGGRAVDRFGPRLALFADVVLRGGASASLLGAQLLHRDNFVVISAVAACCAVTSPLSFAASRTWLPRLVHDRHLNRGNAVLSLSDQAPIILAAALAAPALLWLSSAAFAVPMVLMIAVGIVAWPLPSGETRTHGDRGSACADPAASPWRSSSVIALMALSTIYFTAYGPLQPLLPFLVKDNLNGGAGTYSVMRIMTGLGSVAGLLLAPWLCRLGRPGVVNALGVALYGLVLMPMLFVHSAVAAVAIYTISGVTWGPYAAVEATALQRWTDSRYHGRVFGTQRALVITAIPIGGALGSLALNYASVSVILAVAAAVCIATGLVALCIPAIRRPISVAQGDNRREALKEADLG